jgi:hypothetical protein
METRQNSPYGRLDSMLPWTDPSDVGERCHKADCSMPAHSKVSDVVEEDHGGGGFRIDGFAEERANDDLRSAWFTDDSAPEVIEFALKALHPARQISCSEIRSTGNDDTRRLPFGVGVNYLNPAL